jgi:hypothetical protein
MIKFLRSLGITGDVAYLAGMLSSTSKPDEIS